MSDMSEILYLSSTDWCEIYIAEYRLLDRITRMNKRKLTTSYTTRKLKQVVNWVQSGRGQGRGEDYSPWIRITKGFSTHASHQVFGALPLHKRNHHFLSQLEYHTAVQLGYLGGVEIRECLPMWPTEHQHPIKGDPRIRTIGLLDIAADAGIEHGNFIGSDVPYIGSLDMLVSIFWNTKLHHLGVSCKPTEILNRSSRAQERVRLDELYCRHIGALHHHEGGTIFNPFLVQNLDTYKPIRPEIVHWSKTTQLVDFSGRLNESAAEDRPLHVSISLAGKEVKVEHHEAPALWRVGAWLHLIDIDMGQRISMLQPIRRGQQHRLHQLAAHFLGGQS
jgi:hypothetical protein